MWLIVYTWLQHTDVDVPHLGEGDFSYMRGAFLTIDRPCTHTHPHMQMCTCVVQSEGGGCARAGRVCLADPKLIDWLHHRIGTTHVAHHIDCTIPHYHGREATDAIAAAFPKAYLYEPTPVHLALWRIACHCIATKRNVDGRYVFVPLASWKKG